MGNKSSIDDKERDIKGLFVMTERGASERPWSFTSVVELWKHMGSVPIAKFKKRVV